MYMSWNFQKHLPTVLQKLDWYLYKLPNVTYNSSHKLYMIESRVFYELGRGFHTTKPVAKKTGRKKKTRAITQNRLIIAIVI
jgi:hypothetical protein